MNRKIIRRISFVLTLVMLFTIVIESIPYHASDASSLMTFDGWTVNDGFDITSTTVYEGSYSLEHNGKQSDAISDPIELEDGVIYYLSAAIKNVGSDSKVTISLGENSISCTANDKWEFVNITALGRGENEQIKITATGTTYIDSIAVNPFIEGKNLITNGNFDYQVSAWTSISNLEYCNGTVGDRTEACLKTTGKQVGVAKHPSISVETNTWYVLSADFY